MKKTLTGKSGYVILPFKSQDKWEHWLSKNHSKTEGIWIQFYKKTSAVKTVSYSEALDVALCYGWIDGLVNRYDEKSYLQKFTPRRKKSIWSKINRGHVARLIDEGRMKDAGHKEIEAAKKDGRWETAYDSPSNSKIPDDFIKELSKNKKAKMFFEALNKANKYAIAWRLQTAKKPETRVKRFRQLIEMMKKGEKIHG